MIPARFRRFIIHNSKFIIRFFRWSAKTPRRKAAWVLLVAYLVNQFVYPLIPFLKDNSVHANGVIEPVALGTSLFVNRNPDFNVWFGDRLDQSKHKIVFEVSGHEIEMRLQGATESSPSGEIDELIANLRKELQKPYLTTTKGNDSIDQKIGDKATIRYEILPDRGVKESIIISEVAPTNQFVFSLKLSNGVQLKSKLENLNDTKLNASGSAAMNYYFVDSKGKYLAHFEPLVMTDAAGAMSNDIKMEISDKTLTITANQDWLNSPDRVFPIDLDPTIVHDKNPDFSSGTENRSVVNSTSQVETQFKELQADINTVGLWHFNEGSSTTAYDASGNAKNGTLTNGPVWNGPTDTLVGLGKSNLSFDNADDYVAVGALTSAAIVKTVEFWTYPKSTSTEFIDLNASAYINVSSGTIGTTGFTSPTVYVNGIVSSTLVANQWQHVAVTTETALNASATNFGKRSTSYLNGYLDEVRISNKARTPEEIAASASRFPYSVHESPVIDFSTTPNTLDSLNYSGTGIRTGDGETPYSRDGLIAQWNFNETSGTVAYNTAGNDSCGGTPANCNGTLTTFASTSSQDQAAGTGWTANNKRWGAGGLMFDNSDDYVNVPYVAALNPSGKEVSIEAWVNGTLSASDRILNHTSANAGYGLRIDDGSAANLEMIVGDGTSYHFCTKAHGMTSGTWNYVAGTYNGYQFDLYVNGKNIGTCVDPMTPSWGSVAVVLGGAPDYWGGTLDAVKLYSRAITASEVLSNSQVGNLEFQTRTGATATPNDGTWEAWKTTSGTGDTQIDAMDATTGWAWDGNTSDPTSVALDTTTKIEGTGSLKNILGMPEADANTVALYHLEETSGTGAYIQDSSATNADGTPTGTTVVDGFYGKARSFNGSSDFIDVGTGPTSVKSVEFWVNPTTTTEYFVNLTSTTDYIWANAGTVTATGFTSPTIYVNGAVSSTIVAGQWQHVAVTSATAENASNLDIGRTADANYLEGKIDEVRFSDIARSADEIAEGYRAGRDHRLSKTISSTDLSAKTKLPFYVASDRPGTFLEATVGESALVNYEAGDSDLKGLWHLDENSNGSAAVTRKDSSGNGNDLTDNNTVTSTQGKIGKAGQFTAANSEYLSITDNASLSTGDIDYTVANWVYLDSEPANEMSAVSKSKSPQVVGSDEYRVGYTGSATDRLWAVFRNTNTVTANNFGAVTTGQWYFVIYWHDSVANTINIQVNNSAVDSAATTVPGIDSTGPFTIGQWGDNNSQYFNGKIDEVMFLKRLLTADERRQMFEIGKRTHPITIDFKADLDSSNLITNTSDLSFAIQPDTDVTTNSLNINKGEKIIVKENVNGTEYLAQGNVTNVTYESNVSNPNAWTQDASSQGSSTTVTVTAWDSGSTVPSGGFTTAATVFKWQREYLDLTQITQSTHRDAITRITMRVTDGSQGSNVWIDDFESADYSDGSRVTIGSTAQRYFQYRTILTSPNTQTTPTLTNVTVNYNSGTTAQAPKVKDASTDFSATGTSLNRVTDTGSSNSPSLELAYKELPTDINTLGLYHFNTGACATDSSGNAYTLTANGGMTCATGGKFGYTASGFATTPVSYSHATILDRALTSGTIESWINPANLSAVQTILYADSTNDTLLTLGTSGQINFATSGSTNLATANSLIAASSWYHIAATWTSSGHKIYINGVEQASDTNTTTHTNQDYTTYVGVGSGGNTLPFSSLIDEVRISNIARTPEEIKYDAGRRPYGVYTSDVQNLGTKVSSIDNIRWTENGVQTGDGETPYSTNGLVAQWNFNETSGTTAAVTSTSSCGTSCNGTLTTFASTTSQDQAAGTGWTKDNRKWGAGGLMFDGTDDQIVASDNTAYDFGTGDFSISLWTKFNSIPAYQSLMGHWTSGGSRDWQLIHYGGATNTLNFQYNVTSDINVPWISQPGVWYHIVATRTSGSLRFYVNGQQVGTTQTASASIGGGTDTFKIGGIASNGYVNGVIDTASIYSRALTAAEIQSNYNNGNVELQTRTGTTTTPNDGTWEEWRPSGTATEIQLASMDNVIDIATPSASIWQGVPIATASSSLAIEGTGSLRALLGAPKVDSSTVGLWHLDETSGNANDSSSLANTLTANASPGVADGFFGKARTFNGSTQYFSCTDANCGGSTKLDFGTGDFSVETWVKPSAITRGAIVNKFQTGGQWYPGYNITLAADGTVVWYISAAQPNGTGQYSTGKLSVGKWSHLVLTRVSGVAYFYINGVQDNTLAANYNVDNTYDFQLGASWDGSVNGEYFNGTIDEVRVSSTARTAEEIAEAYRAGRDHRISKSVSSVDLSAKSKVPLYIASDRPGTFLEATVGESAYANYEPDANTVGLWHLEEDLGSADTTAFLKDSSGNGANMDPGTTTAYPAFVQGKLGKARYFDGGDSASATVSNPAYVNTLDLWIKPTSSVASKTIATNLTTNASSQPVYGTCTGTALTLDVWTHIAATSTSSAICALYQNGVLTASNTTGVTFGTTLNAGATSFIGTIDEVRLSNIARTADEIRQAYEVGKRTHQITNDFVTTPQAAYSSGTSVTINNPYGTTNLTDTLSLGDTMIFKENVGGTETVSQGTVTGVTNTSSTYGTVTLLAAPTFPSGGFTTNATVFKWQREFFDITNSLSNQRDAITRMTLRVTDGSQGANVWIDDIKAAGPYLTQSTTRTASVTSTVRQYLQYRIIFSTTDPQVSPTVTSVSVQTHSSPVKVVGSDTLGADGSFDKDGNLHLGSNNVKKVAFYDRTKDQISYALDFDNSNDYVAIGTGPTSVKTVEFWVNPNSTSTEFIDLNGSAYINVASGTIGTTGFTSPTVYVDGAVTSTVVANKWQHIAVTTATGLNATALNFGKRSTSYFNGQMDEVALYSSTLTAAQVTTDYNIRRLAGTETGLVALYHFDEGQGTRAYDSTGGFHGTLTNMAATSWVNSQNDRDQSALSVQTLGVDPNWANGVGRESYALNFTESTNYVDTGFTFTAYSSGISQSAWIKTTDTNGYLIANGGGSGSAYGADFILESGTSNVWMVNGGANTSCISTTAVNDGNWHHIAFTWTGDTTTNGIKIYVDGLLVKQCTSGVSGLTTSSGTYILAQNYLKGSTVFAGQMDEVAIFNVVRTPAQISSEYNAKRLRGDETSLSLLYHLDENTGITAYDASTNARNGTLTNSPTWVTDARAVMDNNSRYLVLGSQSSVSGDKGMEIYAISTTQFKYRWTGDQTWSSAVNFSSYPFATPAQLGTTGVYVGFDTTNGVFGDESYFLIPSWAVQQFGSSRGIRRSFPERSYLIATDRGIDIIDADDNTLWMRTTNGVSGQLLGTQTLNVPSSVTMNNGQLVVGTNGTAGTGVYRLDFNRDTAYRYNATNRTTGTNNLAKRNATDWSWGSADTGQNLIDSIVNDVSLLTSNGRLVMATANNTGLTKIANIMSNDTSYDYSDVTSNAYNRVKLGENYLSGTGAVGDLYALNSTNNALERWNNVVADAASETNGTPDATVNATSTPALFASAQTVNDLDVKTGTSLASAGNNTVFVAHNGGTTTFQENRATLASSSVKYYTKDYIGEEMVGDIKAYYPFNNNVSSDLEDVSIGGKNMTQNGTLSFTSSAVRGNSISGFSSGNFLSQATLMDTMPSAYAIGFWFKSSDTIDSSLASQRVVWYKYNINNSDQLYAIFTTDGKYSFGSQSGPGTNGYLKTNQASWTAGTWYNIVVTHDSTNGKRIFVNGTLDNNDASKTTIPASGTYIDFTIGGNCCAGSEPLTNGTIDEFFVTGVILTATQIQQMYVAGKEALNNKYRVKLASDTVNQLAGSINVVKGVAASDNYIFAGTNTTGADDGILSRVLLRGDVTDRTYDESTTDPVIVDNDINSVAVSKDGAYIVVGTDDQGITIIHNGAAANRLRSGAKVQGPSKRPSN